MSVANTPVGDLLRLWRQRRRLSQMTLALEADTSPRHLSFVETGRSNPSRELLLRLAERLDLPLRERNRLLLAAGFAPLFPERRLEHPELAEARRAVQLMLAGHEPYPALAVDRRWRLVAANRALAPLLAGAAPHLLAPPVNVLRLSLHPDGLGPRIVNHGQWRAHVLERLRRQIEASGDEELSALRDELVALPAPPMGRGVRLEVAVEGLVVPLQLRAGDDVLTFIGTTTVFGGPVDVTLSELAIESFFPADAATADHLRGAAAGWPSPDGES